MTKTTLPAPDSLEKARRWHQLDAGGQVLGRVATQAASLLRGKNKRAFTPAFDCGDFVVVLNAAKVRLTGTKAETKTYFRHSGYASGMKLVPYREQMLKDPTQVVRLAVKRMLPANRLRDKQLRRLKIFTGAEHPYPKQVP